MGNRGLRAWLGRGAGLLGSHLLAGMAVGLGTPLTLRQQGRGVRSPQTHVVRSRLLNGAVVEFLEVDIELDDSLPAEGSERGWCPVPEACACAHTCAHTQCTRTRSAHAVHTVLTHMQYTCTRTCACTHAGKAAGAPQLPSLSCSQAHSHEERCTREQPSWVPLGRGSQRAPLPSSLPVGGHLPRVALRVGPGLRFPPTLGPSPQREAQRRVLSLVPL